MNCVQQPPPSPVQIDVDPAAGIGFEEQSGLRIGPAQHLDRGGGQRLALFQQPEAHCIANPQPIKIVLQNEFEIETGPVIPSIAAPVAEDQKLRIAFVFLPDLYRIPQLLGGKPGKIVVALQIEVFDEFFFSGKFEVIDPRLQDNELRPPFADKDIERRAIAIGARQPDGPLVREFGDRRKILPQIDQRFAYEILSDDRLYL